MQFLLLSGNLIHYQISVARLYAVIPIINDYIAYQGEIDEKIKDYAQETTGATLSCVDYCFAFSGSFLEYQIEVVIDPLFASFGIQQPHVCIIRQKVLVGY